jgi:ABC-type uncharacterized transport system involved in gliding motility auxiliary subunit
LQGFGQPFGALRSTIEQLYNVVLQHPAWMPIEEKVDVLLVAAPTKLTPAEKFRIDQFVMSGKPVIFLSPGMNVSFDQGISATPARSEYEDLLAGYGVRVRQNIVLEPRQMELVRFGNSMYPTPYPYWVTINYGTMNPESPITANLQTMSFPWTSSLDLDSTVQPGVTSEPLVFTSSNAWEETGNLYLVPRDLSEFTPVDQRMHLLAALVSGPMKSAYAHVHADSGLHTLFPGVTEAEGQLALRQSQGDARVLVVGNGLFASDFYLEYINAPGNHHFLLNALDYLALDPALINVRSRQSNEAPLDAELSANTRTAVIVANMALAPLLLVLLGVGAGLRRRKREARMTTPDRDAPSEPRSSL